VTTEPLKIEQAANAGLVSRLSNPLRSALLRLSNAASTWRARAMSRDDLAQLNDDALKDIGLSRADAYRESSKPFWRE
jgi:uncharacterized protein YjiS (DUF1127 family)